MLTYPLSWSGINLMQHSTIILSSFPKVEMNKKVSSHVCKETVLAETWKIKSVSMCSFHVILGRL